MTTESEQHDRRDRLQRALVALKQMRAKLDSVERVRTQPIAIVGLACRFPGGANNAAAYWDLLREGREGIMEVPPDRWDIDAWYDPDPDAPGKVVTRFGGFLDNVDCFDPQFFGIAPREAAFLDPQHRLLLEVAWESLEDAAIAPDRLWKKPVGVFVGISSDEYGELILAGGPASIDRFAGSGNARSVAAGRLSYSLGFVGPCLAIDTACSSSLVAVHLACQGLRNAECDLALAGGVNVLLTPTVSINHSRAGMLSPDGRCKTFDDAADGFVRSEGCGLVALKRLDDALADGDNILAMIRGSATNQDGHTSGLTVPNGPSQQSVITAALKAAGVAPEAVGYLEAHGTGTSLGDPIELNALAAVFGGHRPPDRPLVVGSVKTNIGHAEAAAGIAGLIKVVLSLQNETIPPHLHCDRPTPHFAWDEHQLAVPKQCLPWPANTDRRRVAGVSSFGFSGSNAHVVIEEAPRIEAGRATSIRPRGQILQSTLPPADDAGRTLHLLPVSAPTEEALHRLAGAYVNHLEQHTDIRLADLCHTAGVGRSHFRHRLAIVGDGLTHAAAQLATVADGRRPRGAAVGDGATEPPKIAFLFTGQGAQHVGMGRQLYDTEPTFREVVQRCDDILRSHLDRPLREVLYPGTPGDSPLDETAYTQPALFVLEYALAELWKSWGIVPDAVMGHSIGEYVAACVAGVFSLEDALQLVATRARLMQGLAKNGSMAAIFADPQYVAAAIARTAPEVTVAAANGPQNTVISGRREDVATVTRGLRAEGIDTRQLTVSHAFHCPLVEPMLPEFADVAASVAFTRPEIDLVSNLTGQLVDGEMCDPDYWCRHARHTVRFADSIGRLWAEGYRLFVEAGPKPVLLGMARRCVPDEAADWLPSLRPGHPDWQQILDSLAELYVRGVEVDWRGFDSGYERRRIALPFYPFRRERYWIESPSEASRPPPQPARSLPPDFFPSPQRLETEIRPALAGVLADYDTADYRTVLEQLEALSAVHAGNALRDLGVALGPGDEFTTDSVAQQGRLLPHYRRLLERCLSILADEGILSRRGDHWQVLVAPSASDPDERVRTLLARYPEAEAELTLLNRCGAKLAHVLRGDCDPLGLLFPGDDSISAARLYQDSPGARLGNAVVKQAVQSLLAGLAPDRPLRILEIGAGTGGTTSYLLPELPAEQTQYLFTDVSAAFLGSAEARFRDFPFVNYESLDIERAPWEQGFAREEYDLVIAANVLHATRDLRVTLQHVRQMMACGGMLVLLEGTKPLRFIDLIFGLTEGWWRFVDVDLRPSHPLLSAACWKEVLGTCGFDDACALPASFETVDADATQVVILARADAKRAREESGESGQWSVSDDRRGAGRQLRPHLESAGDACATVAADVILRRLAESSPERRRAELVTYTRQQVAEVLRLPVDRLDVRQPLNSVGLDSLMAVELRNRFRSSLSVDVPMVKFMEDLDIRMLAAHVDEQLADSDATRETVDGEAEPGPSETVAGPPPASPGRLDGRDAGQLLAELDQLSDTEVEALLNSALADDK